MALQAWMQSEITRDQTLRQWAPLVARVARRTVPRIPPGLSWEDILSFGMVGLWQALMRYKPGEHTRFEAYATPRIRGAILDGVRTFSPLTRTQLERMQKVERAMLRAEQRLGRYPQDEEVAAELGLSLQAYRQLLAGLVQTSAISLDDLAADLPGGEDPAQVVALQERRELLARAIDSLPERERLIIDLYYYHELTFREIGAVLGVTESRVCQLHAKAVLYLRGKLLPHQSLLCSEGEG